MRVHSTNAGIADSVIPFGGRRFATLIVLLELFGASVLYVILMGECASKLFKSPIISEWNTAVWTVIMSYLCLPVLLCPRMKIVAWFSVIALISLFSAILIIIIYCIVEAVHGQFNWANLPTVNLNEIPISLNIIIFSYCAHSALPGIEGTMRKPEDYGKVMNFSFGIAAIVKLLLGLICTLVFGESLKQTITDSMTDSPAVACVVQICLLCNVVFSMPLVFYIMGEHFDCEIMEYVNYDFFSTPKFFSLYTLWFVSTRTALLHLAMVCGIMVPHFALVMSLIGSITGSLLCFIFPALFHLRLFRSHLKWYEVIIRILIIIFGILVGGFGVVISSIELRREFS